MREIEHNIEGATNKVIRDLCGVRESFFIIYILYEMFFAK